MEATLEDLLHAINILGEDRDILVDGINSIAVCPPVKMTPAAREHFKQALTANVVVEYENNSYSDAYVCDDDEKINEMAWELLKSLAGYCHVDGYDQWFKGETAKLV
ncbi:MAG: hypothetical protein K2N13_00880 [Paraprevotella sp.]|nr:hypothetical protein [Paraprevotella sp.]